jgi:hypothetical protein
MSLTILGISVGYWIAASVVGSLVATGLGYRLYATATSEQSNLEYQTIFDQSAKVDVLTLSAPPRLLDMGSLASNKSEDSDTGAFPSSPASGEWITFSQIFMNIQDGKNTFLYTPYEILDDDVYVLNPIVADDFVFEQPMGDVPPDDNDDERSWTVDNTDPLFRFLDTFKAELVPEGEEIFV